jgi:hypothetical protein
MKYKVPISLWLVEPSLYSRWFSTAKETSSMKMNIQSTPWRTVLLKKLTVTHLGNKLPALL